MELFAGTLQETAASENCWTDVDQALRTTHAI
jgi:hypothetical protein